MFKKLLLTLVLALIVSLSLGVAFGEPINPTLTLAVEKSPLTIWPPMMIYTAKLSPVPSNGTSQCNFLNSPEGVPLWTRIGSAPFDNTGKAQIHVQMNPGAYQAVANTTINGTVITSNIVHYKVP